MPLTPAQRELLTTQLNQKYPSDSVPDVIQRIIDGLENFEANQIFQIIHSFINVVDEVADLIFWQKIVEIFFLVDIEQPYFSDEFLLSHDLLQACKILQENDLFNVRNFDLIFHANEHAQQVSKALVRLNENQLLDDSYEVIDHIQNAAVLNKYHPDYQIFIKSDVWLNLYTNYAEMLIMLKRNNLLSAEIFNAIKLMIEYFFPDPQGEGCSNNPIIEIVYFPAVITAVMAASDPQRHDLLFGTILFPAYRIIFKSFQESGESRLLWDKFTETLRTILQKGKALSPNEFQAFYNIIFIQYIEQARGQGLTYQNLCYSIDLAAELHEHGLLQRFNAADYQNKTLMVECIHNKLLPQRAIKMFKVRESFTEALSWLYGLQGDKLRQDPTAINTIITCYEKLCESKTQEVIHAFSKAFAANQFFPDDFAYSYIEALQIRALVPNEYEINFDFSDAVLVCNNRKMQNQKIEEILEPLIERLQKLLNELQIYFYDHSSQQDPQAWAPLFCFVYNTLHASLDTDGDELSLEPSFTAIGEALKILIKSSPLFKFLVMNERNAMCVTAKFAEEEYEASVNVVEILANWNELDDVKPSTAPLPLLVADCFILQEARLNTLFWRSHSENQCLSDPTVKEDLQHVSASKF